MTPTKNAPSHKDDEFAWPFFQIGYLPSNAKPLRGEMSPDGLIGSHADSADGHTPDSV